MGYVEQNLHKGEKIKLVGKLHWIIFLNKATVSGLLLVLFSIIFTSIFPILKGGDKTTFSFVLLSFILIFFIGIVIGLIEKFTTEIVITDKRIIKKIGLISRDTKEMNLSKIETINIDQSIIGRILNFGTLNIQGTGSGISAIENIINPLEFRNKIYLIIDTSNK